MGHSHLHRNTASGIGVLLSRLEQHAVRTILSCVLLCTFAFSVAARPLDDVIESKVLRVVVYADNAPFSWEDEKGTPHGIDVEIGKALAEEIGVKPQIIVRVQGEDLGDDLRGNVWKGPLTGGGVGDLMLHVPTDRELAMRNPEAVIGNPYFQETVALAINPGKISKNVTFDAFKAQPIGVKLGTVSDYFLMTFEDGALINNVHHHTKAPLGIKAFLEGEFAAILGVRSELEGLLHEQGGKADFTTPPMDGIFRSEWVVGTAVNETSRDLGYAVGAAITKMREDGRLKSIFSKFGVTYLPPPGSG